jgi:hypothetical protein
MIKMGGFCSSVDAGAFLNFTGQVSGYADRRLELPRPLKHLPVARRFGLRSVGEEDRVLVVDAAVLCRQKRRRIDEKQLKKPWAGENEFVGNEGSQTNLPARGLTAHQS